MNKQGWTYKKLGEVAKISSGKTIPATEIEECYSDGLYPCYGGNGLRGYVNHYSYDGLYPIIGRVGALCGNVHLTNGKFYATEHALVVSLKTDINPKYTEYSLKFLGLRQFAKGVAQPVLSASTISAIPIPVPSVAEQERIVDELDLLSGIIEKKKEQLKAYDQLAQSIFYTMFGDISDTAFPIKCLNDVCEFIKDGTHQTPTYTDDKENGVKFLSAKDVVGGTINWASIKYIPIDLHKELHKRIAPQRNDILLCKNGTTGICAIVETDEIFDIYVSLALLRPRKPYCPKYLLYAINNPLTKEQFDRSLKGVGVPNLHLGEIKKARIIYPPLALQQEFAAKVEAIEQQKALVQQSIAEVQTLFDSRMDYWFG